MPTLVGACGFECGRSSLTLHWLLQGSTTATFSTTTVNNGTRSLRCNPTAGTSYALHAMTGQTNIVRFYARFATLPNADCQIAFFETSTTYLEVWFQQSDSKIYARAGGVVGASGFTVTTGQWYRVDAKCITSGNPWTLDVSVNGTALGQATNAVASTPLIQMGLGSVVSNTSDVFFDDFCKSVTAADYPIGAGKVHHFVPTSDGSHNTAPGVFIKGEAGAAITNATTDTYLLTDEVPLDETTPDTNDYVNQAATGGTNYVEQKFGPAPGITPPVDPVAPRFVELVTTTHESGAGTGNHAIRLFQGSFSQSVIDHNRAGVTTIRFDRYGSHLWNGNPWTTSVFNDLRVRFGFSSDTKPEQNFDGAMIEAEFATPDNTSVVPTAVELTTATFAPDANVGSTGGQTATPGDMLIPNAWTAQGASTIPIATADQSDATYARLADPDDPAEIRLRMTQVIKPQAGTGTVTIRINVD